MVPRFVHRLCFAIVLTSCEHPLFVPPPPLSFNVRLVSVLVTLEPATANEYTVSTATIGWPGVQTISFTQDLDTCDLGTTWVGLVPTGQNCNFRPFSGPFCLRECASVCVCA